MALQNGPPLQMDPPLPTMGANMLTTIAKVMNFMIDNHGKGGDKVYDASFQLWYITKESNKKGNKQTLQHIQLSHNIEPYIAHQPFYASKTKAGLLTLYHALGFHIIIDGLDEPWTY